MEGSDGGEGIVPNRVFWSMIFSWYLIISLSNSAILALSNSIFFMYLLASS